MPGILIFLNLALTPLGHRSNDKPRSTLVARKTDKQTVRQEDRQVGSQTDTKRLEATEQSQKEVQPGRSNAAQWDTETHRKTTHWQRRLSDRQNQAGKTGQDWTRPAYKSIIHLVLMQTVTPVSPLSLISQPQSICVQYASYSACPFTATISARVNQLKLKNQISFNFARSPPPPPPPPNLWAGVCVKES